MSDPADLSVVLRRAAKGLFPATDGGRERAALWRRGVEAVVAMTGHAYLAVGEDLDDVEGVGEARAQAIKEGLSRLAESAILDRY
mgnify:CR=1 FL=1